MSLDCFEYERLANKHGKHFTDLMKEMKEREVQIYGEEIKGICSNCIKQSKL